MAKRSLIAVALIPIGVSLAVATVGARGSEPSPYGAWAPGISSPMAAANALPTVTAISGKLNFIVSRAASATGGQPSTALTSVRLLRSNLGTTSVDLFAFRPMTEPRGASSFGDASRLARPHVNP